MHRWFHFRVTGAKGTPLTLRLENAHTASFPEAWQGYQTVVSYDRLHWFRTETSFEPEGALVIKHTPKVVHARPSASPLLLPRGRRCQTLLTCPVDVALYTMLSCQLSQERLQKTR